jgi:hypothetical protein
VRASLEFCRHRRFQKSSWAELVDIKPFCATTQLGKKY